MTGAFLMLGAWAGLAVAFALLYLLARRIENYGIVDIAWSYAFAVVAAGYAWGSLGWGPRRLAILVMAATWSLRLGTHLYRRVMGHHPEEDSRYRQLREDWAGVFAPKMFGFFQLQAVSVIMLALPYWLVARNPTAVWHPLEILGCGIWLIGIVGESVADAQLARFRATPEHRGQVCAVGLWRYSRHPNYFCEWLIWVGIFVFACASPWGWLSILSPVAILHLLLNVTGVPLAEASSLKSKGDKFRAYQARTHAFFPGPPKA